MAARQRGARRRCAGGRRDLDARARGRGQPRRARPGPARARAPENAETMTTALAPGTDTEVVERARRFVDAELIPREEAAEAAGGHLPAAEVAAIRAAGLTARLN